MLLRVGVYQPSSASSLQSPNNWDKEPIETRRRHHVRRCESHRKDWRAKHVWAGVMGGWSCGIKFSDWGNMAQLSIMTFHTHFVWSKTNLFRNMNTWTYTSLLKPNQNNRNQLLEHIWLISFVVTVSGLIDDLPCSLPAGGDQHVCAPCRPSPVPFSVTG